MYRFERQACVCIYLRPNILFRILIQYFLVHVRPVSQKHQHELTNNRDSRPTRNAERSLLQLGAGMKCMEVQHPIQYSSGDIQLTTRDGAPRPLNAPISLWMWHLAEELERWLMHLFSSRPRIKTSGSRNLSGAGWSALAIYASRKHFELFYLRGTFLSASEATLQHSSAARTRK